MVSITLDRAESLGAHQLAEKAVGLLVILALLALASLLALTALLALSVLLAALLGRVALRGGSLVSSNLS